MRSLQDDGIYTSDEEGSIEEVGQEPALDLSLISETEEELEGSKLEIDESEENAF